MWLPKQHKREEWNDWCGNITPTALSTLVEPVFMALDIDVAQRQSHHHRLGRNMNWEASINVSSCEGSRGRNGFGAAAQRRLPAADCYTNHCPIDGVGEYPFYGCDSSLISAADGEEVPIVVPWWWSPSSISWPMGLYFASSAPKTRSFLVQNLHDIVNYNPIINVGIRTQILIILER